MKRILMIAYHFPPLAGSSGIQRTLRFVQHLPELGWQPIVLSADPRAYEKTSDDLLADVPAGTIVKRAFALDTGRHLTIKGRYLGWMARPDRWISWKYAAIREGMRLIEKYQPDVIWSTYPIATAHVIAAELQRRSGLPWVADFRDPMAQEDYPTDPKTWHSYKQIEEVALQRARHALFTTPSAARMYRERYPQAASRISVLENGFDEESFPPVAKVGQLASDAPVTLLHSGIIYPSERDPTQLFIALGRLVRDGHLGRQDLRLRFRAAVHDELLRSLAAEHGVADMVEICPSVPYKDALQEMMAVDALLVMQAANCNAQIPAKIYEYLRAGRPILALTDPAGDTAGVLHGAGLDALARLDSADEIATLLPRFLAELRAGQVRLPRPDAVQQASRRGRSASFVQILDQIAT